MVSGSDFLLYTVNNETNKQYILVWSRLSLVLSYAMGSIKFEYSLTLKTSGGDYCLTLIFCMLIDIETNKQGILVSSKPLVNMFSVNQIWVFFDLKYLLHEFVSGFVFLDVDTHSWKEKAEFLIMEQTCLDIERSAKVCRTIQKCDLF